MDGLIPRKTFPDPHMYMTCVHAEEDGQKDNQPLVSILKHGISCKTTTTQLDQPHESGQQKPQNNLNKITRRRQNINPHKAFFSAPSPPISISTLSTPLSLSLSHTPTKLQEKNPKPQKPPDRNKQTKTHLDDKTLFFLPLIPQQPSQHQSPTYTTTKRRKRMAPTTTTTTTRRRRRMTPTRRMAPTRRTRATTTTYL
jgi:hypothetical protein